MKMILLASVLALGSVSVYATQVNQDCYCPTCPGHKKKCAPTGDQFKRIPYNNKQADSSGSKKKATGSSAKTGVQ